MKNLMFLVGVLSILLATSYSEAANFGRLSAPPKIQVWDENTKMAINEYMDRVYDILHGRYNEIGNGESSTDYTLSFNGETYDGSITWMEDENYFRFDDDVGFSATTGIMLPHIMQSDNTDQSIVSATAAQVITFDTDVHHYGINRTSSSRFTITKEGSYLITFSAVVLSGTAGKKCSIWMRKNGDDVDDSSTYYTFKSANANTIVTVTFIYHFDIGDYFELWWWGNDTGIKLDYTAAVALNPGVTPAIPACPSIIMTCNYAGKD